ncbi:hypothetical protein Aab01nite_80910 [Paractinoplanes abujensis]|nr:hypothetical protein Aab01nite_80910 [Actinoplanes abujensis]
MLSMATVIAVVGRKTASGKHPIKTTVRPRSPGRNTGAEDISTKAIARKTAAASPLSRSHCVRVLITHDGMR